MKKKRKKLTRAAALLLAGLLTVNSVDLSAFTVYAQETAGQAANADEKETTDNKSVVTITGFAGLEENITNQQLAIGAGEEEIVFPDTLDVTVSASDETSETEETTEKSENESESSEMENVTGESESTENTKTENSVIENDVQEQKEEIEDVENTENTDTASIFDTVCSAFAPMMVYAAESHAVSEAETKDAEEEVDTNVGEQAVTTQTKNITLTDITWELNPAESDGEVFDSSEDCDGYCYVYTPVLPKTDAEGNTLVLSEEVEIPMLYVLIGEGEHVSLIAEGYDEEGFCEAYEWANGTLTKKIDADCEHDNCNGFQPATEESYDVNGDGTTAESEKAYKITNVGQLYWFAAYVNEGGDNLNANAYLANDIAINANLLDENGNVINGARKWTPIGNRGSSEALIYNGVFDGNNHTISNLYIAATKSYQGLFGDVNEKANYIKIK